MTQANGKGPHNESARAQPVLRSFGTKKPLPRRRGDVADEASLRARVDLARVLGDTDEERTIGKKLAQRLAARDELDAAVDLASRTLAVGEDAELRMELARWLEGLGEPGLAASELRRIEGLATPEDESAHLVRIGVLHARAGDAHGAEEAFLLASEKSPKDALPLELLGSIAGWAAGIAPDAFTIANGADAYIRAAKRRALAGDAEAELEDLLRAFELDRTSATAADALSQAHASRGRPSAADEVLRAHASALEPTNAAETKAIHVRRRTGAMERGDLARALGAALDERLDAQMDGKDADTMDDLLLRAGAYELLAARLAARAEKEQGAAGAARWIEVGRLMSGPLSAPERATEAYARAVAADATNTDALHALRALVQSRTSEHATAWLLEAFVRGALGESAFGASKDPDARIVAARELARSADEIGDAVLAAWAHSEVARLDWNDERARASTERYDEILRRHEEAVATAQKAVSNATDGERERALVELVRLLRSAPGSSRELANALLELSLLHPDDMELFAEVVRVAERIGDHNAIASLASRSKSATPRVRVARVMALSRAGDAKGAAEAAKGLFDAVTPSAYSLAWLAGAAAGDDTMRARALAALAPTCTTPVMVAFGTTAAEVLARAGERDAARRAGELACRADPQDARALAAFAALLVPANEGVVATKALERVVEVGGPSATACTMLADAYETLGEAEPSIAWARRAVALSPGDAGCVQSLVDRAARLADASALSDALSWLVPQPRPVRQTAEAIAPALMMLANADSKAATKLCHRALDVLGPRVAALREAIDAIAAAANDDALGARVLERWLAAGAPAAERGAVLLDLAKRYAALGDVAREVFAYERAARAAADLGGVKARIESLADKLPSTDAELAWLEARAEMMQDDGAPGTAQAFRELGAAYWDMADDRARAISYWLRAAQQDSLGGYATLRSDLSTFADASYAVDCLAELAARESDRVRGGIIATEAARAAYEAHADARAFMLAKTALDRDPKHTAALETAELACSRIERVQDMAPLFDQVARRSLGRFGRRAAHHRAARYFDAGGIPMLALKHAAQAFIAVPSEGSTLALLARTAERAHRRNIAVKTLEHVAELSRTPQIRAAWLLRAANLAGRDLDGTRQRTEVLLKAAVLSASPVTLGMLAVSARELLSLAPDDADALAMRLERANQSLARHLEGPDGARIAIIFAEMALDLFEDGGWAWRALERAMEADSDVDEYTRLLPHAHELAHAEGAGEALSRAMASIDKPYANIGHALLRLVGAISKAAGDQPKRARAFVLAALKESDDDELVAEADEAMSVHPDQALLDRFSKRIDAARRTEALRNVAKKVADEDAPMSMRLYERASAIAPGDVRAEVAKELRDAMVKAGKGEDLVLRDIANPDLGATERAALWTELGRIREEKGELSGATDAFMQAATEEPTVERWEAVERVAEQSGREHLRVEALQKLVALAPEGTKRVVLKRLARAEGVRGALAAAEAAWREVWAIDPADVEADVAIEALLVARASYGELAEHLAKRATRLMKSPDEKETLRAVRLRRAAILEQRLARLDEAAAELEQLIKETPGHASATRWLCDLYERVGQPHRALPALDQLILRTRDLGEKEALGLRRVRLLLASGDVVAASATIVELRKIAPESREVAMARLEVARASEDPQELGAALTSLAEVSNDDARARSELLIEAAQAAARAGNPDASLARAREAAALAPEIASTQLFARGLEYRLRGAGTKEDAEQTIAALKPLTTALEAEDVALRAFLLAEAEDVVAPGAGESTLRECHAQVGTQPLVSLGLGERAAAAGQWKEAVRQFTDAVGGNLLGLRRAGFVALAGADAAERAGDADALLSFVNEAAKDPETRLEALRRLAQISIAAENLDRARSVVRRIAEDAPPEERTDLLVILARALLESKVPSERIEGDRTMREAIEIASPELAEGLRDELTRYRARSLTPAQGTAMPAKPPQVGHPALPAMPRVTPGSPAPPPVAPKPMPRAAPDPDALPPVSVVAVPPPSTVTPPNLPKVMVAPSVAPPAAQVDAPEVPHADPPVPAHEETRAPLPIFPPAAPVFRASLPDLGLTPAPARASVVDRASVPEPISSIRHPPLAGVNDPTPMAPPVSARSGGSGPPPSRVSSLPPSNPKVVEARAKIAAGAQEEGEKLLGAALRDGSLEAADELDAILSRDESRSAALIKVRRQAVELCPGDLNRLASLRDAAKADQNFNYVRAIDHVLRAFDASHSPLAPPPLSAQNAQPGMLTLLTRHSREPAGEAFASVWEGAQNLFGKPPAFYGIGGAGGVERVVPGPASAMSRLYEVSLRLLDTPRFTLFHRRAPGLVQLTVALLASPSAILSGEGKEDSSELRWMLGHALSAVLPQNALVLGMIEPEARALFRVMVGAFGPPGRSTVPREHAALAEMLWQTLAPRVQRRLRELLSSGDEPSFDLVLERAKQSGRRVGMFFTGDFGHAARAIVADQRKGDLPDLERPGGLRRLCTDIPALADLYRLAVRPEYADARWHVPTPTSQRFNVSARIPPV